MLARRWISALFVGPAAAAACELVNDPGDLLGGRSDAGGDVTVDAPPNGDGGADAAPQDATGDDRAAEGAADGPLPEGAPDASSPFCVGPLLPANPPSSGRWCDTLSFAPRLCSDFDLSDAGSLAGQGWTTTSNGGGTIALVDAGARTSPNAVSVSIAPVEGGVQDFVAQSFPIPGNIVHDACLELDIYPDTLADSTQVASFELEGTGGTTTVEVVFGAAPAGIYYVAPDGSASFAFLEVDAGLPLSAWTRVRFHLRVSQDGGPAEVEVAYGGQFPTPVAVVPIPPTTTKVTLAVGGDFVQELGTGNAPFNARIDDVVFDVR